MPKSPNLLVTADSRIARLYACSRTPGKELHLELLRTIENTYQGGHTRHNPVPELVGAPHGATPAAPAPEPRPAIQSVKHPPSSDHEPQEELRHFAFEIKHWLDHACKELHASEPVVFTGPRLVGLLRDHLGASATLVSQHLSDLSIAALAVHPAVKLAFEFLQPVR